MSRILLLNPPGDRTYLRDSYCSKVSKAAYLTPPIDLTAISGYLDVGHELYVLDAMAERLDFGSARKRIAAMGPDLIISLFGQASFRNDISFFKGLKKCQPGARLVVSGDAGFDGTERLLRGNPFIDAVLLDYTSKRWLPYVNGKRAESRDIAYLNGERFVSRRSGDAGEYCIGVMKLVVFPYWKYRMPYARRLPYAGLITDFGCPFHCDFCLIGGMPYRLRDLQEVMDELRMFKALGVRYFSFGDQTFGAVPERTERLLSMIRGAKLGMPWGCFSRADLLDGGRLDSMKAAGCDTIVIGVESGSQSILDRYHKGLKLGQIREAFDRCRRRRIRTVATFIVGLPGETEETFRDTLGLAMGLDPDFASFNVPVAKPATPMREWACREGWLSGEEQDQSARANVVGEGLTGRCIREWQRRANLRFYLRPGYLLKRLISLRSRDELMIALEEGRTLLAGAAA